MKRKTKPLGTIAAEEKACVAAFNQYPQSKRFWCCHHTRLHEPRLDKWMSPLENASERMACIKDDKPHCEKAIRYRNFRPVKPVKPGTKLTARILNKQWPDNTWDNRRKTIFTK